MTKTAVTKLDANATVFYLSKPFETYLSAILPKTNNTNLLDGKDEATVTVLSNYIKAVFNSDSPLEEILHLYNYTVQLTGHCFDGEHAIIYWKDMTDSSLQMNQNSKNPLLSEQQFIETTLNRFTNNLPLVVFEINLFPDGRFEFGFVNEEMKTFFPEFNREAVNADNSLLFIRVHPDDKEKLLKSIKDVFKFYVWNIEYRVIHKGEIRWVKGYGRPERGKRLNENIVTVCTFLQDITDTKTVTEQLKLVDFAFQHASTPTLIVKKDATIFQFNDAATQLYGYSKEELSSIKIFELDYNYSIENWSIHWDRFKENDTIIFTSKQIRKDGVVIDVEVKANLFYYNGEEYHYTFISDITQKHTLEEQLKLVDFSFRKATTPMIFIKEDGSFLDFNEAAYTLLDYTYEEFKQLKVPDINPNYDADSWVNRWMELKVRRAFNFTTTLKKKDGSLLFIDAGANIIKYSEFEVNCAVINDVTEKKKLDEQLRLVDFSFRNAATPMSFIRRDGTFYDFNDATCNLLGYTREEYLKLSIPDINPLFDLTAWVKRWNNIKEGKDLILITKLKRKDGSIIDVEVRANIIHYGDFEINCAFYTDITEKKQIEERLGLVNFVFEKTNVAIIIANTDSTFHDFNEAAQKMHGYSREEMLNFKVGNLVVGYEEDTWEDSYAQVWNYLKEHNTFETVVQHKRKDGRIIDVEIKANYIKYGDLELNCSFITDISERKRLEERLKLVDYSFRNAATTIHLIKEDGTFYDFNEAAFKTLGYNKEEYQTLTIPDIDPNYNKEYWPIHWEELKKAGTLTLETVLRRKDNSLINVEVRANFIHYGDIELNYAFITDITEKKRIEEALKKSNERYEYATLATSDVVWETDVESDILYLGNNFTLAFGHQTSGIEYGSNNIWRNNLHKDDLENVLKQELEVITGVKDKWESEYRFLKADGSYAIIFDRGFGVKDESGKVVRLIGAMQDITEKKQIAEDLIRSNKRYEFATLATSDVVWETDLENKTLFLSNNFTLVYGHKIDGLEPMEDNIWRRSVHPEDLIRIQQSETDIFNSGQDKWQGEYRMKKADGTYALIFDRSFAIRNEAGEVIRLIGAMEDITLKRQEEERLKLFETVILNTTEAIIIRETKQNNRSGLPIVYVNDAFTQMTGYSLDEIKGKSLKFLNGPLTQKEEQAKLRYAIDNFQSGSMEVINYKKNGEIFWASISIFPVANNEGKYTHWVSIQRDVTVRKEAEKEREKLLGELVISNKELRQFSYITTHNLRAPLTNLISICRLLKTETIQDSFTRRLIDAFKTSTTHLNDTLNDLINILIIKENPNIPVARQSLKLVFDKVIDSIANLVINTNATLDIDFSRAATVDFNNAYLESIFLNLLTNSFKYAHPDRSPIIKIRTIKTKEGSIQLTYSDNGLGMNMAKVKDRIFGLYQRFHDNADSKGIGLYLIHSQIIALGGTIEVASEVNVGTTFTITFKVGK